MKASRANHVQGIMIVTEASTKACWIAVYKSLVDAYVEEKYMLQSRADNAKETNRHYARLQAHRLFLD